MDSMIKIQPSRLKEFVIMEALDIKYLARMA